MLFDRWREIVHEFGHQLALNEVATGRTWTFSQLAAEAENGPARPGLVSYPQGHSANFIVDVLRAWRSGQILCPLESGQSRHALITSLPKGIIHLKTTSATTGAPCLVAFTAE